MVSVKALSGVLPVFGSYPDTLSPPLGAVVIAGCYGEGYDVDVDHDEDLSPSPGGHLPLSTQRMFVGDEVSLYVSFAAAQARLASLIRGSLLGRASEHAYSDGITGLARVGPLGPVPGLSRLVQVHVQDLKASGNSARFALRWEVIGPGGELFPALDADITLIPAGEYATTLTLIGAYRPPLGTAGAALDRAVMHQVATATIRAFLYRIAESIAYPAGGDQQ